MSKTSFSARARSIGKQILTIMRHVLFHNGWVKLIAILISLVLWAGLISQDESLTREKTWQNVNVSVTGEDTLKRNGYIIVNDLEELLSHISVTAAVPQKQYDAADVSIYNVRLELSRLMGTGTQELKLQSTASSVYGRVINTIPSTVSVQIEEYSVRQRVPVSAKIDVPYQNGWYKEWYMPNPAVDPTLITVSGPRDLVKDISIARVLIDPESLEWSEGTLVTTGEIQLYDRAGKPIESPLLDITTEGTAIDTVLIEGNVLPTKSFSISDQVEFLGGTKEGYKIVSTKISPETITVAARNEVLEQMNEIAFDRIITLDELDETTVFQIKVQKPSEDAVLSNDTVTVTVEVERDQD